MKYICLGNIEPNKFRTVSDGEGNVMVGECFAYDDLLRKDWHLARSQALQSAGKAKTLRRKNGKGVVTDGPYAETKELLGGILVLEAPSRRNAAPNRRCEI